MANFFTDNTDLQFRFSSLDLQEILTCLMANHAHAAGGHDADAAWSSTEEAVQVFAESLDLLGDISANQIAPRSAAVDAAGSQLRDGKVVYSKPMDEARTILAESGFMGVMLPPA